jgi:hypothetical protein
MSVRIRSFCKVAVLLAQQCAEYGHKRKLVIKVVEPVRASANSELHGSGAELFDAGKGVLNARGNSRECLIHTVGNAEQLVVRGEAHAWHLLDVHKLEGIPNALGVRPLVLDVGLLQAGEVREDVAGSLLLALTVRAELFLVLEQHLAIQNEGGMRERFIVVLGVLRVQDEGW